MMTVRWHVRTLLGLVLVVALGVKGVLLVRPRPGGASGPFSDLARLTELRPRPAFVEPALVAALDDPDAGVRHTAVWALDRIGSTSPALVHALIVRLEAETEESRWRYRWNSERVDPCEALKRIKPPAADIAALLRKAMASKDRWVRLRATEVLCEAAGWSVPPAPALAPLLLAALQDQEAVVRMRAPEALARFDADTRRKTVAVLLEQLRRPDRPAQLLATIGLARFVPEGQVAVAILADRLRDGDTSARLLDLYLLGRLGPVAIPAVPAVVRVMTSRDAGQNVPFFLTGFLPRPDAWHSVEFDRILHSGERSQSPSTLCTLGAAVLGRIGPEAERQAVDVLGEMLRGEDESQRLRTVDALGALGPKASTAIPPLLILAERKTHARPGEDDWLAMFRLMTALEQVCMGDDPRLVAALVRMLKSSDSTKRQGAALTLSRLQPPAPAAIPVLVGALEDETQAVRCWAASALGRFDEMEGEATVPALLDALGDEDDWVRIRVARSLAHHRAGASRAVPQVVRLLRSENPNLRRIAAETLGAFGPAAGLAVPLLLEARHDAVGFVRDAAEAALKAVAPSEAANPVE